LSLKELRVTETKPKGILASVEGLYKTGKSEFGLTMPKPLFVLNLNFGLTGIVEKHVEKGEEIYALNLQIPLTKDLPGQQFTLLANEAATCWKNAVLTLREALTDQSVKSIFIDTGSELWDLLRLARLGKLTQVLPVQYTAVNAEFRQLLQVFLTSGKNILLSHKVKPEYVNDQKTNRMERAGFGDIGYDVQVELRSERDAKRSGDDQFGLTFLDCRANKDLKGKLLTGHNCTFLNIVREIYPDIPEAHWQ
jgi:hypothetical protein